MFKNDKEIVTYINKQMLQEAIMFDSDDKAIDLLKRFSAIKRVRSKEERKRMFNQLSYDITKYVVNLENQSLQTDRH